jgi:hypothetical protein
MNFHVVLLNQEQSSQTPPLSKVLLDRTEPALLSGLRPIILFCDVIAGKLPGIAEDAYLFNDVAWVVCQGMNLNAFKTIDDAELPEKYGVLIGPSSASCSERRFS